MRTPILTFGLCLLLAAAPALAGDRKLAAAKYKEGEAAFAAKDYAKEADAFEQAYREDPRGASIYNAAMSWQALASNARAADDFEAATRAGDLPADLASAAHAQLAKLEAVLVHLKIVGPADAKFTGAGIDAPTGLPFTMRAVPGTLVLHVAYGDGRTEDKSVDAKTPGDLTVDLTPAVAPPPVPIAPGPEKREVRGLFGKASIPVGIVFLGTSAAFIGAWVGLGVAALGARDEFAASGYTSQDAHDRAALERDLANFAAGFAIATAAMGVITLVTVHKVPVSVGIGSVSLHGTF